MAFLKATIILSIVIIFAHHVSTMDFSALDSAQDSMMQYFGGKERIIEELNPSLIYKWRDKTSAKSMALSSADKLKGELVFVPQNRTYKPRSEPSSQFLQAIERGFTDAQDAQRWGSYSPKKLQLIKKTIKLAAGKRMFQFSRRRLGEAIFFLQNQNSSSRPKRSVQGKNDVPSFINDLKLSMGNKTFDDFIAVMGDVTLMFAIDTTGSMRDEIETAKRIAVDIINHDQRKNPVNYILSPFNDPMTGPVTFRDNTEGGLFVEEINKLDATAGGDCPEYALKGIYDALLEGPDPNSPMYVFTDASAKDNSPFNVSRIKTLATSYTYRTTINFFITDGCTVLSTSPFHELAEATSGQVLRLSNNEELRQLTSFTGSVLSGSNIISSGSNKSNRKKRRAVGNQRYSIKIDDSIEKMSVCVTTQHPNQGAAILLTNPRGAIITSGKRSMSTISVYEMTRPSVGTWNLVVPASAGKHDYFVKCSSGDNNIDFEFNFYFAIPRHNSNVSISEPLIGKQTSLVLTMEGFRNVQNNTVVLELITKYGEHITNVPLTPDSRGKRYVATFTTPSRPFKLKIKGTTKAGNAFERISRNVIEPKHILLRVLYSVKDFTLERGQKSQVMLQIFNAASVNKVVEIRVDDKLGYASLESRSTRKIRRGRWVLFGVTFKAPPSAAVGTTDTAIVSITVKNDIEISSLPIQLIVVA